MLHRGAGPWDKENHRVPVRVLCIVLRHRTGEGRDVGSANYKARLNLRVCLATGG
jgi:hypothetical protein